MKRSQLIEYGLITTGLVCGYKFLENILAVVFQLFYAFGEKVAESFNYLLPTFVLTAVYGLCFVLLIRRSGQIATWLQGNAPNDHLAIKIHTSTLFYIILIGIMIVAIISHIPNIIIFLFESFKNEVSSKNLFTTREITITKEKFYLSAIQVIIALLAVFFGRTITGWFIKKDKADELTFQSDPETKD